MDTPLPDDFDPYDRDDDMVIKEGRDPWTVGGILLNILVTICGVAWVSGRNDQRLETSERDIAELKAKSTKDSAQDIQIAVITTQLTTISTNVGEIKARLEQAP